VLEQLDDVELVIVGLEVGLVESCGIVLVILAVNFELGRLGEELIDRDCALQDHSF
jgi:hypothetical protein